MQNIYVAHAIRKLKNKILKTRWQKCEGNDETKAEFGVFKDPFISVHADCIWDNESQSHLVTADFYARPYPELGIEEGHLIEVEIYHSDMQTCLALGKEWLYNNTDKAIEKLFVSIKTETVNN